MLKRIISLILAFLAGAVWMDKIASTNAFQAAPFEKGPRTRRTKWSDVVASARVGSAAGEEIADRFFAKHLK